MVYIDKNSKYITIPRHTKEYGESNRGFMVYLSAPSYPCTTLVAGINNTNESDFYWKFNINGTKPLNIGEYTYEVEDIRTKEIIEKGLLVYGDYTKEEVKSINNNKKNVQLKYGK